MAEDQAQEKTEQATPKRLREAREKGQVARSRELSTFAVMIAGAGIMLVTGNALVGRLAGILNEGFSLDRTAAFDPAAIFHAMRALTFDALLALVPLLAVLAAVAVIAPLALGGWVFSAQALGFKWDKLDPVKGMKRVFSPRGLMELAKALGKFALVLAVGLALLWQLEPRILGLGVEPVEQALAHSGRLLAWAFLALAAALLAIALIDVPFQLWNHARQLRMTRQEIKDEYKETEGRPEVKAQLRQLQREIAQRRMMSEVPKADVIVTNPTHYAVALRYDPEQHRAPVLVAKGRDLIAEQIRRVGAECKVPLVSAPPLARAVYFSTEIEAEIPAGLYLAVAQVLAYVYQLRAAREQGAPAPEPVKDLPIPEELRR